GVLRFEELEEVGPNREYRRRPIKQGEGHAPFRREQALRLDFDARKEGAQFAETTSRGRIAPAGDERESRPDVWRRLGERPAGAASTRRTAHRSIVPRYAASSSKPIGRPPAVRRGGPKAGEIDQYARPFRTAGRPRKRSWIQAATARWNWRRSVPVYGISFSP